MKLITKCLTVCSALALAVTSFYAKPMDTEIQSGEAIANQEIISANPDGSYTVEMSVKGKNSETLENTDILFLGVHSSYGGTERSKQYTEFLTKLMEENKNNRVAFVVNCKNHKPSDLINNVEEMSKYVNNKIHGPTAEGTEVPLGLSVDRAEKIINGRSPEEQNRKVYVVINGTKSDLYDLNEKQVAFLKKCKVDTMLIDKAASEENIKAFSQFGPVDCIGSPEKAGTKREITEQMTAIFDKWADKLTKPNVTISTNTNGQIINTLDTDIFDYKVTDPAIKDEGNGKLVWNIGDVPTTAKTVQFKVTPKPGKYGTFNISKDITLNYSNDKGESKSVPKPEIGDPEVTVSEKFVVTYQDGANGEVFKDQVTSDLEKDSKTPEFTGKLERPGYKFKEWSPTVENTVSKNAIYVAQWDKLYNVTYSDGANGEVFKDQVTSDLMEGTETPKFDGEPSRDGYTFKGWSPEVSDKVTGDATYVAQWEPIVVPEAPAPKTYTVTYTDGVDNSVVFEDKVFDGLAEGDKTPDFGLLPTRDGFTFAGWSPVVANTVTGDVTYVAQWTENPKPIVQLPKTGIVTGGTLTATAIAVGSLLMKRWF